MQKYIHCPKCNKRLMKLQVNDEQPKIAVVKATEGSDSYITTKCGRCKSIVSITK